MTESHRALPINLIGVDHSHRFSIDCGTILSKLIYFDSAQGKNFKSGIFPTAELEQNLKGLSVLLKSASEVYLTGSRRCYAKSIVASLFSAAVTCVNETEAISLGFKSLIENVDESSVLYEAVTNINEDNIYEFDKDNPLVKMMRKKMDFNFADVTISDDGKITKPSILIWGGVSVKFYLLKNDGITELKTTSVFGGETYRGLSKCLIDSNDYERLTDLAINGRRENVDTQVYEIFAEDPNSPYGKFPPQFPIFSFGKCADIKVNKEDMKDEDCLSSLSHLMSADIMTIATQLCQIYKVNSIYIGGGLFLAPVFQKFVEIRRKMGFTKIKISILDCNYVFALGAILKET